MATMKDVSVFTASLAIAMIGCSSSGTDAKGGAGQTRTPGASGSGSANIELDGVTGGSGTPAQSTPDGLEAISGAAAAALKDPAASCATWNAVAEGQPSVLEFVVDVSGSMNESSASTGRDAKWEVTREALRSAVGELRDSVAAGLAFYPNMVSQDSDVPRPIEECVNTEDNVAIAPLTKAQRTLMQDALDHVLPRNWGATPTHDAYNVALGELRSTTSPGKRHVALITDGQPTQAEGCVGTVDMCNPQPTDPIVQAIANANAQDGIATFIVGSPGSEANVCTGADVRSWLSAAARAGGTALPGCSDQGPTYCHFDISSVPDFGSGLASALGSIASSVLSCNYRVPSPPPGETIDPQKVNVIYSDGSGSEYLVLPSTADPCDRGWHYAGSGNAEIEICGLTCDLLKGSPQASITLVFGCTTGWVPVE